MQAIILAAGMGSRLGNLTEVHPKCMVEVDGVSMIERMLRQLDTHRLSEITIVGGYKHEVLEAFVRQFNIQTPIRFIHNDIYDKTNNIYSLYCAQEILKKDDTILLESDLIFEDALLAEIIKDPAHNSALVSAYEAWMDGTVVTLDENHNIVDFLGKESFRYDQVASYYKTINIYKMSKQFSNDVYLPFLEALMQAKGRNEYYESVLKYIVAIPHQDFKAVINPNLVWYEVDDKQDLDIASVMFASSAKQKLALMQRRFGGYWRYPNLVDFCYLVNPFYPNQRLLDEVKGNFERLVRDYPSGMGVNALLAAKHFGVKESQIVIGNGAAELIKSLMENMRGSIGVIAPTFEEYPNRCAHLRVETFDTQTLDYQYSVMDIMDYFERHPVDTLVLINPDNPSGNYIAHEDVKTLCTWCQKRNMQIILDESFIDFVDAEGKTSLMDQDILETYPNLYLVKSISKSYGVPGFRLGVLASADEAVIDFIKKDVSIWNINSFGEYYMQIVDKYKKDFKQAMIDFVEVRNDFVAELQSIEHLKVYPSQANYIMIELLDGLLARDVCEVLLDEYDVFIKDLSPKQGFSKEYIRIAVKRPEENAVLLKGLKAICMGERS